MAKCKVILKLKMYFLYGTIFCMRKEISKINIFTRVDLIFFTLKLNNSFEVGIEAAN